MATQEELEYLDELERELQEQSRTNRKLQSAQMSLFGGMGDENLIKWQLDLREDLDRIYHLLRGDQIKEDEKGNTIYYPPEADELKPFNEFGVQLLMNIMSFYLSRNIILSNYSEELINEKIYDFGIEISDLIFNRYEDMMMTTTFEKEFKILFKKDMEVNDAGKVCIKENGKLIILSEDIIEKVNKRIEEHILSKIKMYSMLIRELVDSVHSAYLRALHGGERDSLRTARTVTQSDSFNRMPQYPTVSQPKRKSILNPFSWFR